MNSDESDYLSRLLDEIDIRDPATLAAKDIQHLSSLREEILKRVRHPNFGQLLCRAFEGGHRKQLFLAQGGKLPDDTLLNMCRLLKFSAAQSLALSAALIQSQVRPLAQDALKLMYLVLPEVATPIQVQEMSEDVIRLVYGVVSKHEELMKSEVSGSFIAAVRALASAARRPKIVARLSEYGANCALTADIFLKTLQEIAIPLDEEQVAEIMVLVLPRSAPASDERREQWNLDAVAEVLSRASKGLNWPLVVKKLDQPGLSIRSEMDFQLLTRFYLRISGVAMSAAGLMRPWVNRNAQLAILILGAKAPRNLFDFSSLVTPDQYLAGDIATPPNYSWICSPLYAILIELATAGMSMEVLEALSAAAGMYPEYVFIGLAQVQDPTTGVRAELLRRLLPQFCGVAGAKPSTTLVMARLQIVNPDLLLVLFRLALKKATTIQEILETDARLRNLGGDLLRRLEEEASVEEVLSYCCVRADRQDMNLEDWAAKVLERNPQYARVFFSFCKVHAENLRPRNLDNGGLLSFECFATLLRAVQPHQSIVSVDEMRSLASTFHQQKQLYQLQQQQQQQQRTVQRPNAESESLEKPVVSADVEEEANAYFHQIYSSAISIDEMIEVLKRFKSSETPREQDIFRSMIHNLLDEFRFFQKYPDKELQLTGRLFGALIYHQLISSITLGIGLRYVLESVRRDPHLGGGNEKLFKFGCLALEQFRPRFGEWPQFCSHLIQLPHFATLCPELAEDANRAVNGLPLLLNSVSGSANRSSGNESTSVTVSSNGATSHKIPEAASTLPAVPSSASDTIVENKAVTVEKSADQVARPEPPQQDVIGSMATSISELTMRPSQSTPEPLEGKPSPEVDESEQIIPNPKKSIVERILESNPSTDMTTMPTPEALCRDQILFIVNNIAKDNCESKTKELKTLLMKEYYVWFANFLVVKRVTTMPNLHPIYLHVLELLESSDLYKAILDVTYHHSSKLLASPNITSSSSERSLLRNLGIWLGQVTLGRNKTLLQRRLDLKDLLMWGYESARLIAVCSFVAKIIEGCKTSKVFRPPNPWLMAVLGVLRELYEIEDLKINIKFEVQVLCKNINVKIDDIPRTNVVSSWKCPIKDNRNPDFTVKPGLPPPVPSPSAPPGSSSSSIVTNAAATAPVVSRSPAIPSVTSNSLVSSISPATVVEEDSKLAVEQTVIPSLSSYITVNPSLQYFVANPAQKYAVALAVDRAIREIIQAVVERSVSIASVTARSIVSRDFATESNEQHFRMASQLIMSGLAGSLATTSCRDPLKKSISIHLRMLLKSADLDEQTMDEIVSTCVGDNIELGCLLIEKATMEKATLEADGIFSSGFLQRRKCRESGQSFADQTFLEEMSGKSKFPRELPESLLPSRTGLSPQQLLLYEGFEHTRIAAAAIVASTPAPAPIEDSSLVVEKEKDPNGNASLPLLTMSQAIEAYQVSFSRLEHLLAGLLGSGGRELSVSSLSPDHEVFCVLREILKVTQRIQPSIKVETAMTVCETVFKKLMETAGSSQFELFRIEILIGVIDALKEACGSTKFSPNIVAWLGYYSNVNINEESARTAHKTVLMILLRAKLLRSTDLDNYFNVCMDSGRNLGWVELALTFIHQCLLEKVALTHEFPSTFETISKMRPSNVTVRKQLQKWLLELRALTTEKEGLPMTEAVSSESPAAVRDDSMRKVTILLLDRWLRVWNSGDDKVFGQYLHLMHQYGVLKTEESADQFFRSVCRICAEEFLKELQDKPKSEESVAVAFDIVDAVSKLFLLLLRLAEKEAGDLSVRVSLLARILNAVGRTLVEDHELKKSSGTFDQRPYFRLFVGLSKDLGVPNTKAESPVEIVPILTSFTQVYLTLNPKSLPGFAFSWLQLISHRSYLPHLLLAKGQLCWPHVNKLMVSLLQFLYPYLSAVELNDPIRRLYKGTLRVVLILLHDFPEFLCEYYFSLCEAIPRTCVQLRNLILSACPSSVRLPDPLFTPNLKVDLLPEITQQPKISNDFEGVLKERNIKGALDGYFSSGGQSAELPEVLAKAISSNAGMSDGANNTSLLNSIVLYVGMLGVKQMQSKIPLPQSLSMVIFKRMLEEFDAEWRYLFFGAIANQLRYPNCHTHFFSCAILCIFAESDNNTIKEQLTRVLLERLIASRPHPWGLLITFMELIKNPGFRFWSHPFTKHSPEIERLFESVAKSCMGPKAAAALRQQKGSSSAEDAPPSLIVGNSSVSDATTAATPVDVQAN